MAQKLKPKEKPHYVNNREFSQAVMDYAVEARAARNNNTEVPKVTDYIARCFIKISEGLSHRPNFSSPVSCQKVSGKESSLFNPQQFK